MNKWLLKAVMAFSSLYKRLGADVDQLRAILETKLIIDDRRPISSFNKHQRNKEVKNSSFTLVFISLLFGLVSLVSFMAPDYLFGFSVYFVMFTSLLSMTLISDFSSVLIDVKDNFIILPKPVNSRTILLSRLLHIGIHLAKMVIPMSLPGIVFIGIAVGLWGALALALVLFLATGLCIFMINALYLLILKLASAERFKDVISNVQVVFSVFIFALFYLGPRMMGNIKLTGADLLAKRYAYVLPQLWLSSLWNTLVYPHGQPRVVWIMGLIGLVTPFLGVWLVIRYLAPGFDKKLGGLGAGSASAQKEMDPGATYDKSASVKAKRTPLYQFISRWINKGSAEESGFELSWLLSGRNRDFRMRVYPSFAYVPIYFFYWVFNQKGSLSEKWGSLPQTQMYVLLIYLSSFAMVTAITNVMYSDKYKAAWVFFASPTKTPGEVLSGAIKAMLVKYFIPFYLAVSALALYIWGPVVIMDLVLGLVNVILFGYIMGFIYLKKLPFSAPVSVDAGSGRFVRGMVILLVPGTIGVAHWAIRHWLPASSPVMWIFLLLSAALVWMVYSKYREMPWEKIEQ
jgi:ABC-2 type transport system permease protein